MEDGRIKKITLLVTQGRFKHAETIARELLAEEPNKVIYLYWLSEVLYQQQHTLPANDVVEKAIGLSPDVPELWYLKSRIAVQGNSLREAAQCIRQSIQLDPNDAVYHAWFATIHAQWLQYHEALDHAGRALAIDPGNVRALNVRSDALLRLEKYDESVETSRIALSKDPNAESSHVGIGSTLLEKGEHQEAMAHFNNALRLNPSYYEARLGLIRSVKHSNVVYRFLFKYLKWSEESTSQWVSLVVFLSITGLMLLWLRENDTIDLVWIVAFALIPAMMIASEQLKSELGNIILMSNSRTRPLLLHSVKVRAYMFTPVFVILLVGIITYFVTQDLRFLTIAGIGMALTITAHRIPIKAIHSLTSICGMLLAAIGMASLISTFVADAIFNSVMICFIVCFGSYHILLTQLEKKGS